MSNAEQRLTGKASDFEVLTPAQARLTGHASDFVVLRPAVEYNENHDAQGRFADSDSATLAGAKGREPTHVELHDYGSKGEQYKVWVNPSPMQMQAIINGVRDQRFGVRGLIDGDGNLYVSDGFYATHDQTADDMRLDDAHHGVAARLGGDAAMMGKFPSGSHWPDWTEPKDVDHFIKRTGEMVKRQRLIASKRRFEQVEWTFEQVYEFDIAEFGLEYVREHNEHHDAKGRFATSDTASAASKLSRQLTSGGGFTYQPKLASSPKKGYAVGIYRGQEKRIPLAEFKPDNIVEFIKSHRDYFDDPSIHIGGWTHNNNAYLDLSKVVSSKTRALSLGKLHDQMAVFDLKNQTEISVKGVQRTEAVDDDSTTTPVGKVIGRPSDFSDAEIRRFAEELHRALTEGNKQ
jgi:hypothetical protein